MKKRLATSISAIALFAALASVVWLLDACGGGSLNVGLPNAAGSPNATLSPTSLAFGSEIVGTASPAQSIMLSNKGAARLSIASIAASANFAEATTCGSTLASGASCTISVTFTPKTSGTLNGTISVTDNATDSPQTVSLSGTGTVTGPRCSALGQECGGGPLPPCCPGLACTLLGDRAFCEP